MKFINVIVGDAGTSYYFFDDEEGMTFSPSPKQVMDIGSRKDESNTESEGKKEPKSIEEPKKPKTPAPEFVVPDSELEDDEAKRSSI